MEANDFEKNLDQVIELLGQDTVANKFKEVYNKDNITVWKKYDVSHKFINPCNIN